MVSFSKNNSALRPGCARMCSLAVAWCLLFSGALASPIDSFLRPVFGSACLPLDVRSLLKSELRESVTQKVRTAATARRRPRSLNAAHAHAPGLPAGCPP